MSKHFDETVYIQNPNSAIIKCNQIINGLNSIKFTDETIEFDNYSNDKTNYIDTKTGHTNFIIDAA